MVVIGIGIIGWILCGVISAVVANNKGRNSCGWLAFGVLLGPFSLILVLVMRKNEEKLEKRAIQSGKMKKCPSCAELIRIEATKCRYCGEDLTQKWLEEIEKDLTEMKSKKE